MSEANMYGKLFASMYDGSLATRGPWQALVTFQQLIVLADRDGVVDMTDEAISRRTTVPIEIIRVGLAALLQPDPQSRSPDEDGRRIVPVSANRNWGWRIVNYSKYRAIRSGDERREYHRQYWRQNRAGTGEPNSTSSTDSTDSTRSTDSTGTQGSQPIAVSSKQKRVEARATRFALDSAPDGWLDFCRRERPDLDPHETFARFGDYWRSKAGKDGRKLDWFATWRNWVRNERPAPARPPSPPRQVQGRDYV